ncbi:MAG TPA: carboxypeptidase regulatory-like domain-containing protein [Candidatus Saccharimonadales bacterium]|nr:carboxypeptidase regulatory-like domain-containing protein [Candidatus Saccharimonadales bacterium]
MPGLAEPSPPGGSARQAGSLQGTVAIGHELERRRVHFPVYPDLGRQAPEPKAPSLQEEVRNVIVYFEPAAELASAPAGRAPQQIMAQVDETFVPHVLPILAGSTVDFPNSDPFFHNVFSLSMASAFDLGHYPKGTSKSVRFDKPGLVKVFCHLHADMSAVIMVLENPFFAVPAESGAYRIEGIPPGRYKVTAWHERAHPVTREVTIEPGRTATADFQVPIDDSAGD